MSNFRANVLEVVRRIPKGTTLSYGEVAARAGSPGAARAVGVIMSHNFDETVPCHRVVRIDGRAGGYNRGGEAAKKQRLQDEGVY